MRKVKLTMNEYYKYNIIKKLAETDGNKLNASLKLNCSIRHINRLIKKYKVEGKAGFVHGNKNRKPAHTFSDEDKSLVINLYLQKYYDFNFTHFKEKLIENHDINVSVNTIKKWLMEVNVISPKARRTTRRQLKNLLKTQHNSTKSKNKKQDLENKIREVDYPEAHPRKPRKTYFGEQLLMDASEHLWFGDTKAHLHAAIDDATGKVIGAYFDTQETLKGYYHVLYQVLTSEGIPYAIQTDRRTIFTYKKDISIEKEDTYTNFGYACQTLGIDLSSTSVSQHQGRIERLFQTLQSRLIAEMRLEGITTIEEANLFLSSYIIKHNQQFSLHINSNKSVFETQPSKDKINHILSKYDERVIDSGHSISYKTKTYLPINKFGERVYLRPKTKVMVIESFDNQLYISLDEQLYAVEYIPIRLSLSPSFDQLPEKKKKKPYIPPMEHPWKKDSYMRYVAKQKHRNIGAHV